MRCPKCSYTSFDHFVTCEKCGRDLTEIVGQLHGTSLRVESPLFLGAALEAPSGEEMLDIGGGTGIPDMAMDEEGDSSPGVEEEVAEAAVAEEAAPIVEPDTAVEAPEPPAREEKPQMEAPPVEAAEDFKLTMEAAETEEAPQAAAEEPSPVAEAAEEVEEKISLDFEGLDLSDLTPADDLESADKGGGAKEERPLDLWSLDSSADEDLADLFENLVPAGRSPKKGASAGEPSAAETADSKAAADETGDAEGDKPKEDDTQQ